MVGRFGSADEPTAPLVARPRNLPVLMYSSDAAIEPNSTSTCPPSMAVSAGPLLLKRYVDQINASHHLEQFPGKMGHAPSSSGAHVELAWIGSSVSYELWDRFGRNGWNDHHDLGTTGSARDRRNVADEIEIELLVKRRITRVRKTNQEKRVAISGRIHDGLGGDVGTRTGPVLDDELLAGPLR